MNEALFERSDFPRPDWIRREYVPLDGEWEFQEDPAGEGEKRAWHDRRRLSEKIHVPFCVESKASGIGRANPAKIVWYKKRFRLEPQFTARRRILLHFGAVDYEARVWMNGKYIGSHEGGFTPFSFDVTDAIDGPENALAVRVRDSHDPRIPRGKQTCLKKPFAIFYTTVTGIWQPVWIESVGAANLKAADIRPDAATGGVRVAVEWEGWAPPAKVLLTVNLPGGGEVAREVALPDAAGLKKYEMKLDIPGAETWSPGNPRLYPLRIELAAPGGETLDRVETYFGFRDIGIKNGKILLNGKPLYQKLLLNQGFFPEGHFTPVDAAIFRRDVEQGAEMGFNGVRLHQKIENPKFLFWCDALGHLVWEEMPSAFLWSEKMRSALKMQWREAIGRDRNHPCIITWVPLNESWGVNNLIVSGKVRRFVEEMYLYTKELDPTRPVIDNSGFEHVRSDIIDLHHYLGTALKAELYYEKLRDPGKMKFSFINVIRRLNPADEAVSPLAPGASYAGQPMLVSEYGGFGFYKTESKSLIDNFLDYTLGIARCGLFQGYCYTQQYDTEQERNGLLTFGREPKVPFEQLRAASAEVDSIANERQNRS
jgi:beta-galactosidase/beta-glucuronidase